MRGASTRRVPILEGLEARQLLSTFTVTDTSDNPSDTGSLRYAINQANADNQANTINFGALFDTPQTITLGGTQLELSDSAGIQAITGPAAGVTISGGGTSGVFAVENGVTATLSGLTITDGKGGGTGVYGGMYNLGNATLTNCTISGNSSTLRGGGLTNVGTAALTDCTISGNSTGNVGGGLFNDEGTVTLTNCTISGNSAADGGGLFSTGTALRLTGCTIGENYATFNGGGAYNGDASALQLTDCTISGNSAKGDGGGMYDRGTGAVTLNDTIVAGNNQGPPDAASDIGGPSTVSGSNNLIGTGGSGGLVNGSDGNIVLTSLATLGLAPLGDYGGPTETMALLPGSAAIGEGITVNGVTTDQRGFARGSSVDIGAFQTQAGLVVNTTVDGTGSPSGDLSLREAVNLANVLTGGTAITFDPTAFASQQTITLTQGQLELSNTGVTESITGPAAGVTVSGGGASRVFEVDANVTATISGLTITGGSTDGNGGGLYNDGGTATLFDCVFSNDYSSLGGGGLENLGTMTVSNTTFTSDSSVYAGGGINNDGSITITGCTFDSNDTDVTGGGYSAGGAGTVTDSTFSDNRAAYGAGAFAGQSTTTLNLTGCTFLGNSASSSGGAVANGSGVFGNDGGQITLTNCTVSGNTAGTDGGGLFNSTSGTATLTNCTVSGNSATDDGGGLYFFASGAVKLNNTIVAGNTNASGSSDIGGSGDFESSSSNNLFGTGGSGGLVDGTNGNQVGVAEPGLDPLGLQNNGGPTQTIALVTGSPAINTGNNALAVDPTTDEPLAFDERGPGFPRVIDSTVDIGAFEYSGFSLVVSTQPPTSVTAGSVFNVVVVDENALGALDISFNGTVEVALEQSGGSGTSLGAVAAVGGVANFNLTVTQAASGYTLLVSSSALGVATSNSFNVTPAATSQLVVASEPPSTVTAGSPFGLTVTAEDRYGNQTPAFTSNVAVDLENNPGSGSLGGTVVVSSISGVAAFSNLTLDTAGAGYTIEATGAGLTSAITVPINVTPAAASQLLVSTQPPSTVTAGSAFGLTVTALDQFGNIATGFMGTVQVALKNNPGAGSLGGTLMENSNSGVAAFSNLTLDTAGAGYTIQATGTGVTGATTNSFNVAAAAASLLFVSAQPPSTVTAGSAFGLTVTALDQFGNIATGFTGSVKVALKNNPGSGSLGGALIENSTSGVAAFSNLTLDSVGAGYTIQATGTGLTAAITNSFSVTPAAASQLLVSTQPPSTLTAGSTFGLTVTAEDRYGNQTPAFTGSVAVGLKNNPGSASLGGMVVVNSTAGVAAFSNLTLDTTGNGYTIQATGTGLADAITNSFNVTPAAASQLVVASEPPTTVTAGGTFGLTVTAEDQYGNQTTAFTGSVAIGLKNNPGSGSLGGTLIENSNSGVAVFSNLTLDTAGNGFTIQATGTGVTGATTNSFNVAAAAASLLFVSAQPPSTVTAGSAFGLTVTAKDQFGNIATGFTGSVQVALKNNPATGSLGGTVVVSSTSGVAAFSNLMLDTAGNGYTIQATGTGVTDAITNSFNVTPAAASQLLVSTQPPSTLTAGSTFGLTVTAEDRYGNQTPAFTGSVAVGLKNNPGSASLGGMVVVNSTAGVAVFSNLTLDTTGNGYTIQATGSGLTDAITKSFNVTPAAASQLLLSAQPPSTVTAGSAFGLTVTAKDQFGNIATEFMGSVQVALKNNPTTGSLGGTVVENSASGVAVFSDVTLDTAGNGFTIQATGTGLTDAITKSFNVTPAAASQLVVASEPPATVTAGSTFGLTVTAEDQYGNQTPAFTGSVAIGLKDNPGSASLGGTLIENSTSGVAVFSNLTLDTAGNGYTIQATGTGLTDAITNSFDVTPAAATQLFLSAQPPSTVTAGSAFGLTVTAEDQFGNVATGFTGSVQVALKNNPGTGSLGGTLIENSTSGVAVFSNLMLDTAGNGFTIEAAGIRLTDAITNSFNVTPAATSQLVVASEPPTSITAGSPFGLTVTAEDQYGNQTPAFTGSVAIGLKNNPGSAPLGGTVVENSTSGVAAFSNLTLDTAGNGFTIQATGSGLTDAITNSLNVTPAAATQLFVSAQPPSTVTAGRAFGLTVTAKDQFGNIATEFMGSVQVALKNNPATGSLGGTVVENSTSGVAVFSNLTLDTAGNGFTIQATGTGLTDAITNSLNVTPAAASQLVVSTQPPSTVTAGSAFGLTVTALDQFGNIATGFTGSVHAALKNNSGTGSLGGTVFVNSTAGVAVFSNLLLDTAGNGYTIQATGTGLTDAITNSLNVTPAAATQLLVSAQPPSTVTAGSAFGLTVTAEDQFGNVATGFMGSVQVALKNNPGTGSLGGTLIQNSTSGVAVFSNLTLDTAGSGFTIQASGTGLTDAITNSLNVTPAAATQLFVSAQPPSTVTAGSAFGLTVTALDPFGNIATGFTGSVQAVLKNNPGTGALGAHSSRISIPVSLFSPTCCWTRPAMVLRSRQPAPE